MTQQNTNEVRGPSKFPKQDASLIKLDSFIVATRDSGYRGTNSAIAELIDNAIQAKATSIYVDVYVAETDGSNLVVRVLDDGCGMEPEILRQALRFGGSSRFGDRNGLGRFGMGLPNSSLSQSRRLEAFTWTKANKVWYSYIDVDEVVGGGMTVVPEPLLKNLPDDVLNKCDRSGSMVLWSRCDRLDNRKVSTLARKMIPFLGRVFRYFLWGGIKIFVNDQAVKPVDPLYLRDDCVVSGATRFGDDLIYKVRVPAHNNGSAQVIGEVRVRFSELPIERWQSLSNERKNEIGITKGAGVSVVRSKREVDYGWFFMNGKRKENYDDWWRCEIQFDPVLDEAFGITHTKQQVRPLEYLAEILSPDVGEIARSLNNRVRQAHVDLKLRKQSVGSTRIASAKNRQLRPLPPVRLSPVANALLQEAQKISGKSSAHVEEGRKNFQYNILHKKLPESSLYNFSFSKDRFVLNLNPEHPFYRKVYKPLSESESTKDLQLCEKIELLLLASARSDALAAASIEKKILAKYRTEWSNILAAFLSD